MEPSDPDVLVEVLQRVPAVGAEPNHHHSIGHNVRRNAGKNLSLRAHRNKGHHVASHHRRIERGINTLGGQIQLSKIAHTPARAGMILLGSLDKQRIRIDAHDEVAAVKEVSANAARSTSGVENTRSGRDHRIEQASLSAEVSTLGSHRPEPLDIPLRVVVVGVGCPAGGLRHKGRVSRLRARRSLDEPSPAQVDGGWLCGASTIRS